jgi:hypothetical protein
LLFLFLGLVGEARAGFYCSDESRFGGLLFDDGAGVAWEVLDFRFEESRLVSNYLSCKRLIESAPWLAHAPQTLMPLFPKASGIARLLPDDPLIDLCVRTPGCKLNPQFALFRPIQTIRSWLKDPVLKPNPQCNEKPHRTEDGLEEQQGTQSLAITDLKPARVISLPSENFEESIFREIDLRKPKRIVMSTMILSEHIFSRLDDWLIRHRDAEAWVYFSYNLQAIEAGFPESLTPKSGRLHLVPVYQTPSNDGSFHIKGFALMGAEPIVFLHSVNLRRFREEKLADRVFGLKGKVPVDSFLSVLGGVLEQQCSETRYLACTGNLRFGAGSPRAIQVEAWLRDSCANRFAGASPETQIFGRGGVSAVEESLIEWIKKAKHRIRISSHIFKDSVLTEELQQALQRGVRVEVLVGTGDAEDWDSLQSEGAKIYQRTKASGVISHAKFMIFDEGLALWGTANFTKTSLGNPWELFLASKNPEFIGLLSQYFEEHARAAEAIPFKGEPSR